MKGMSEDVENEDGEGTEEDKPEEEDDEVEDNEIEIPQGSALYKELPLFPLTPSTEFRCVAPIIETK